MAVPLLQGTGRPDRSTWMEVVQYMLLVALVWVLVEPYGVAGAAIAWLPAVFASQILAVVFVRDGLPRPFARLGLPVAGVLVASALGTGVAVVLDGWIAGLFGPLLAGLAGGLVALLSVAILDRWMGAELTSAVRRLFPRLAPLLNAMAPGSSPPDGAGPKES